MITNVSRSRIIDNDKAVMFVESDNQSKGKTRISSCVREVGPSGHSKKTNLIFSICDKNTLQVGQPNNWLKLGDMVELQR